MNIAVVTCHDGSVTEDTWRLTQLLKNIHNCTEMEADLFHFDAFKLLLGFFF